MIRNAPLLAAALISSASAVDLVPFGSTWTYLHPSDGIDPAIADTDFNTTWFLPTAEFDVSYNGPAFTSGDAPLGYDVVNYIENTLGGLATVLTTPAEGERGTAYFRTDFTTLAPVEQLALEIIADDGAAIYLDGVLLTEVNFEGADTWDATSISTIDENNLRSVVGGIGGTGFGAHTLAVSVHQTNADSTDLGFDMRLTDEGLSGLPMGQTDFGGTVADFLLDGDEGGWVIPTPASFLLDDADGGTIRSEPVDIAGRGTVYFSMSFTADETSVASNFEEEDTFAAWLELDDGAGGLSTLTLIPAGWDANADGVLAGDEFGPGAEDDQQLILSRPLFAEIPEGFSTAVLVIEAITNSTTEMFSVSEALFTDVAPSGIALGTAEVGAPADIPLVVGPGLWEETAAMTFELNDADEDTFLIGEAVDISALPQALVSLTLTVSETSTASNFESSDYFSAWVEVTDAAGLGSVVPFVDGGNDVDGDHALSGDEFAPGVADEERASNTFPLSARLPAGAVSARIFIVSENNAASETFTLSDVLLRLAPPVVGPFSITAVTRGPGTEVEVSWESETGAIYDLQTSTDLEAGTWTTVDTVTATGAVTTSNHDPGVATETFYRVSRRP